MHIKQAVETKDGGYIFEGELSGEELRVIVSIGLNYLAQQNALPFITEQTYDEKLVMPAADGVQ